MGASQPHLQSARSTKVHRVTRLLAFVIIAVFGGMLLLSTAYAQQSQVSLLTLRNDQEPLDVSNHFGVPARAVANQNGDFAFVGEGNSALFLRLHGASTATRLLQFGDAVPGIANATTVDFLLGGLNSSAHLLFIVDYTVTPPDGRLHRAVLTYNGGSSYSTVTTSDTVAAGPLALPFGPNVAFPVAGGSFNNNGDVLLVTTFQPFLGAVTTLNQTTYYIAPAGGTPVRVVGLGDTMPSSVLGGPATFIAVNGVSQLNAQGRFLFEGLGTNTGSVNGLFLGATSGGLGTVTKVVATLDPEPGGGTTFSPEGSLSGASGELNDIGQVAFVYPASTNSPLTLTAAWLYSAGGAISKTFTGPLPNGSGIDALSLSGLSNLGEAVGTVTLTGSQSLVRIHSNGVTTDTIASTGQAASGGGTFSGFSNLTTDNNDNVSFDAFTTVGLAVYQQTGTSPPLAVAVQGQSAGFSGGGSLDMSPLSIQSKALDNGSVFFSSTISGGAVNFAAYLGTPGSLQVLMSTGDTLPAGARLRLFNASAGGNFVAFGANLTGGQSAIFVESSSGTTTRIVSEGDSIPGFGGATLVEMATSSGPKPFYGNGSGQIAFPGDLTGNQQGIFLSPSSAGPLVRVAGTGDAVPSPVNGTFTAFDFNSDATSLSPINDAGEVAFYGTSANGLSGIFLYLPGFGLVKMAATGDSVPEGPSTTTFISLLPTSCTPCGLGLNNAGQVAFGANKSVGAATGLYISSVSSPPTAVVSKVVTSTDTHATTGSPAAYGVLDPVSGFSDSGQVIFEGQLGGGVFTGNGISAPTVVALDGVANPGTGSGSLATSTPAFLANSGVITTNAAIDDLNSVVFRSRVTGNSGTPDSGYFRVLNGGPLQAAVLQGQTVTGVGTLGTMFASTLNVPYFSVSSGGDIAFTNFFTNASNAILVGQFLSNGNGTAVVQKLVVPGDGIPGTGGGVYSVGTARPQSQGNGGVSLISVLTTGGTASQAIIYAVWDKGSVATSTSLFSSKSNPAIGDSVTFTAVVTVPSLPGTVPPASDIVIFTDNGVAIGSSEIGSNGTAIFTTSSLSAGTHTIRARYFPNSNVNSLLSSLSNAVTQAVTPGSTSTQLFSTQNPSLSGQSVVFEALVSSETAGAPTGTVAFLDNGVQIGTGALNGSIATFTTSSLTVGNQSITAMYGGDPNFNGSTSNLVTQIVQPSGSAAALATFDAPGAGAGPLQGTIGTSINATGIIAGTFLDANAVFHGFVRAANGTITPFDAPGAGTVPHQAQGTIPASINTSGAIAGTTTDANAVFHGFVRAANGTITTFDAPGAATTAKRGTIATTMNDAGTIAGSYSDTTSVVHGFLRTAGGAFTTFDARGAAPNTHGSQVTAVSSIDTAGDVTGAYSDANSMVHGFVRAANGTFTSFDVPGTTMGSMFPGIGGGGINAAGAVTGAYVDSSKVGHSFVRAPNGTITTFDAPGAGTISGGKNTFAGTASLKINSAGDVAGSYADPSETVHGFVRTANGVFTTFDDPVPNAGGMLPGIGAVAINDAGAVTGAYGDANSVFHGFVRMPGTLAILTSSLNPSTYGLAVTLSAAIVSGDVAPPNGESVTFMDGATVLGTGTLSGGSATLTTSTLSAGTHSITAVYGGDTNFVGVTSAAISQMVSVASTVSLVVTSPNPSATGQPVLLQAFVFGSDGGSPSGNVNFFAGATQIGTGTLSGGMATSTTSSLTLGSHSITAVYGGDGNSTGSTSSPVTQVVQTSSGSGPGSSATALVSSVNPSVAFQTVTFTALIAGSSGSAPTGSVSFLDGTTQIGMGTIANGQATFSTSTLTAGSHSIKAIYGGDSNFSGSTSNVVTQVVTLSAPASTSPKFAYAVIGANVSAYTVDSITGALTPVPGSPFATGGLAPRSVSADPSGRFVYVANETSSSISVFSVDATSGALTPVPGSPFATGGQNPNSVSADPLGRFVYVANLSNGIIPGSVSVFSLNATTGALTPAPGSPFASGGIEANSVSADPSGRFIYVAGPSTISVFSLNATTGALTPVPGSPFAPGGNNTNSVSADPGGRFVYATDANDTISVFSLNATTGVLTPVLGSPFATGGLTPESVSADPGGRFVYVANGNSFNISVFSVGATTGVLTPVPGSPFASGGNSGNPSSVSADPSGRFVYLGEFGTTGISVFSVDATTGALTPVPGSPFASAGGTTNSVAAAGTVSNPNAALLFVTAQPGNVSIAVGSTQQFTAFGTYSDGSTRFLTYSATWSSCDGGSISTVSITGVATGVSQGSTCIFANYNGEFFAEGANLTVTAGLQSIAVTPTNPSILVGNTQQFAATGSNSDGSIQDLTASVTWHSTAPNFASINTSGIASGLLAGQTQITAQLGSVISSPDTLTVTASPASQTISFMQPAPPNAIYNSTFQVAAQSTSSLTVVLSVDLGSTSICSLGTQSTLNGLTSATVTMLSGTGTCTIDANQSGNANYSAAARQQTSATAVLASQATLTVTGPASVTFGATGTATATGGSGTGLLTFNAGASTGCSVSVTTVSVISAGGTCSLTVTKAADANYNAATSAPFSVTLARASQATLTVTGPASVAIGTTGAATATGGSGTGLLSFSTGTSPNCSVTGTTVSVTSAGGTCLLTATKAADTNFNAATSGPFTVTVTSLPATTTLASSLNPSAVLQSVTFTATVSGAPAGVPTGQVTFTIDGSTAGSGTLIAGQATFTTSSLSVGSHPVTAQYTGSPNFASSNPSNQITQIVNSFSTSTTVISSLSPSAVGQSVQFTAIVTSPSGGTPTSGTVTFFDGTTSLGPGPLNVSGVATFSTTTLSNGLHSITAHYGGNADFGASISTALTQNVTPYPTSTTLISSINPSISSQSVQFTVVVTSSGGTPNGNVTVTDNTTTSQIGTGPLNANGLATFTTTSLVAGSHSITAQFNGSPNFVSSSSTPLTQTITINPTSTVLVSSLNPSFSTQFVQFTAIVSSSTGATPTGGVNFFDGTIQIGSGTLNAGGQATFGTSTLSIASHSITAQYVGNSSFATSTSAPVNQSVMINPTPTTLPSFVAIASSPNPSAVGQSVSITATVSGSSTITPTGHVTFLDNGTPLAGGVIQLVTGSAVATFSTSSLAAGTHPLTAQYSGDGNFALSLSTVLSQTVGSGAQQVSIQITPIPTNVAPRSSCPSGGYCEQFFATVTNGGSSPTVAWQVLSGSGSIDSTGNYTAGPAVTQGPVTISASVTGASASVSFTLGPDSLTTSQPPATVTAGTPLSVPVQLAGVPGSSTIQFALSCGSLPGFTTCQFSNNSTTPPGCPMGTITFVTGTCPNFTVTFVTTGTTTTRLVPLPFELGQPWYGLIALMLSALALALTGRRRVVLIGWRGRGYACSVLALLCISVVFLASCSVIPQTSTVAPPSVVPATPSGSYQVLVLATPPSGTAGGGFVQTQLIVPLVVK